MEQITSRKNPLIQTLRALSTDASARYAQGLFLCDGMKTLQEALHSGAAVQSVFWKGRAESAELPADTAQFLLPPELQGEHAGDGRILLFHDADVFVDHVILSSRPDGTGRFYDIIL